MESTHTEVSGGATVSSVADLPSDWRRQMDDEMRDALKALDSVTEIQADEFTAGDVIDLWGLNRSGTTRRLMALVKEGSVTVRKAYDPRSGRQANAYKKV